MGHRSEVGNEGGGGILDAFLTPAAVNPAGNVMNEVNQERQKQSTGDKPGSLTEALNEPFVQLERSMPTLLPGSDSDGTRSLAWETEDLYAGGTFSLGQTAAGLKEVTTPKDHVRQDSEYRTDDLFASMGADWKGTYDALRSNGGNFQISVGANRDNMDDLDRLGYARPT